ncbi:telomere repeat binding factor-domain-containing protein [Aspergillus egyptiacus]|nr:telomere repeat binding factor-domain-containing protein [Aspergillus egyptiacus]
MMVNTRGSRPSIDGLESSDLPLSPVLKEEGHNDLPKLSHPLDDDSLSPRASKKRRLETDPEDEAKPQPQEQHQQQPPQPQHQPMSGAGDQIEEELASALGAGVVASVEPTDPKNGHIEQIGQSPVAQEQDTSLSSDVATVISNIMNHSERVEEHCAMGPQQLPEIGGRQPPKGMVFVKANSHLKIQSLPILDNLSTQILSLLAKSTYQDITSFVSEPDSENGQAYATMRSLFDHTKKVYTSKKSFLSPSDLELVEPAQIDIIRKANLASFVSSIFGTQEIGFSELNENFLDVFVPEGGRLLKQQGALFLELKTQAFIASMNNTERSRTELLYLLFPDDMEQQLLDRRPGTRQLAPSETDFVNRAKSRRDILLNDINNEEAMKALPDKYHWEDFLRDLSSYITKNFDTINNQQVRPYVF